MIEDEDRGKTEINTFKNLRSELDEQDNNIKNNNNGNRVVSLKI